MKMNKTAQVGMLIALYLDRSGRATAKTISQNLNISESFIQQVAFKMRRYGVVKAIKGSKGGYELVGKPTVGQILLAVKEYPVVLSGTAKLQHRYGGTENRALFSLGAQMAGVLVGVMAKTVKSVNDELATSEVAILHTTVFDERLAS